MADELILPPPLASDERFSALAALTARLQELDLTPLLVYLVDTVPSSALPCLAEQFHVTGWEGWQFAKSEMERRALIKGAIELHRYKGTRWAIEQVLVTLSLAGKVEEWFEYGGTAHHFKVDVEFIGRGVTGDEWDTILPLIQEYKNVRSHLEQLSVSLVNVSPIPSIATFGDMGESVTVFPWSITELEQSNPIHFGLGHWSAEIVTVYPQ